MQDGIEAGADGRLTLRAGHAELELSPAGGCITAFRWQRDNGSVDWMRPAPPGAEVPPTDSACFPLVPYSNRIREGRFAFEGETYQLALNFPPERHAIHGHGWQGRWRAEEQTAATATLVYDHPNAVSGDAWPSAYRAEQRFELSETDLLIEIAVTNAGERAMPVSLGLHPYFPRTPACRLSAAVGQMWESDAEVMPTRRVSPPADRDPSRGVEPARTALDACFTDFAGRAVIEWPERRARLTLQADAVLSFLVVFTPPGEDFFCVEPVSAMTDAVNLAPQGRRDTGLRTLAPGERLAARVLYTPHLEQA